jgi:chaperone LolA
MRVLLALVVLSASATPDPQAAELARKVEAREKGLVDLQATFEQRYRSGALGREIVERGRLSLKPPGRMRFDYVSPEKKTFVSDGATSYFYVPEDHQVIVQSLKGERGVLLALLAGREGILDRFEPALEAGEGAPRRLRLTPRKADPDVDSVVVEVDPTSLVRRIEILDAQGDKTEFRFDEIRENSGVPDATFRFTPPKGVEVIEG